MENEKLLSQQFDEIENKVERLIGLCRSLEVENADIKKKILNLEDELQLKAEKIISLTDEKDKIRSRCDALLLKLENMQEKNLQ